MAVQERIAGTEMEYRFMVSDSANKSKLIQLPTTEVHSYAYKGAVDLGIAVTSAVTSRNSFLGNGARLYPDVKDVEEYSTPEDLEPIDVTANEMVGEKVMQHAAELMAEKTGAKIYVNKRVIDEQGQTYGYHVSYLMRRDSLCPDPDTEKTEQLSANLGLFGVFAAVRPALFGSGALLPNGDFVIGQKASTLESDYSTGTQSQKPVVNLRDEPLSNADKWIRFHDTSADANMSPWGTAENIGAAKIVLRLIENGRDMKKLRFRSSLATVARSVASDKTLARRYAMVDGRSLTAIEVMQEIIDEARPLERADGLSPSEQAALEEWDRANHDIAQDRRLVRDRVGWVSKLETLAKMRETKGLSWKSSKLRYADRLFDDLDPDRGIGLKLRNGAWADYMPDQGTITDRITNPPATTRALIRGEVIKSHSLARGCVALTVTWDLITHSGRRFPLNDPYATQHHKLYDHFTAPYARAC